VADGYAELKEACRVLGLGERASLREIKARYRKVARECHPDAAGDDPEGRIYAVNAAYKVVAAYVEGYRFGFTEAEYLEQNPEERLRRQFGTDPLWGKA
jgi:hypothetical protein